MKNNTAERLDTVIKQIAFEEGLRLKAYLCPAKKKTIGYGHNLDANPRLNGVLIPESITKYQAETILYCDVRDVYDALSKKWLPFHGLSQVRQDACINMAYQLGVNGFLGFKEMCRALSDVHYYTAHNEAMHSSWAKQTPVRAKRVADQFISDKHYLIPDAH
jgi:lysozyme